MDVGKGKRPLIFAPPPSPKVELPPCSATLDLKGASHSDFLLVSTFLRAFSITLLLSPYEIEEFALSVVSKHPTTLFDEIHLSLLAAIGTNLKSLSGQCNASASHCLRSLNWDFLDLITWPMFLVEYLLFHSPKHIIRIGEVNDVEFKLMESDYHTMPACAKIAILQHLCHDVIESEAFRLEINKRISFADGDKYNLRFFSCNKLKKKASVSNVEKGKEKLEEENHEENEPGCSNSIVEDGNGDECYLCKTDGVLICCDGCPAAYHSKCVGVISSELPDIWNCPECTIDKSKPYKLSSHVRGLQLFGTDPHARLYYSCCHYLLVWDSNSFLVYEGGNIESVIAALYEFSYSSSLYRSLISAICEHLCSIQEMMRDDNEGTRYVNRYKFACTASSFSKELASRLSGEDTTRSAAKILALHTRVISNKYASFSWSSLQNPNPLSRKEK